MDFGAVDLSTGIDGFGDLIDGIDGAIPPLTAARFNPDDGLGAAGRAGTTTAGEVEVEADADAFVALLVAACAPWTCAA